MDIMDIIEPNTPTTPATPLLILNYTNWSSDDVRGLIEACARAIGLNGLGRPIGSATVKNGRPTAWFNCGLQVRLPATGTATPLQVVACNRMLSDGELISLIKDIVKSISQFHGDYFTGNRQIVHLADGLPEWARDLTFSKRAQGTLEWAVDRIPGLQTDLCTVDREIKDTQATFEKNMARLTEKKRKLETSLQRVTKKCDVKEDE